MSEWSDGYTNDIGYTYGYYGELNPASLKIPFLMSGLAAPKIVNACELGFGQGISINSHAAATKTQWFGTDFNPAQTSFAQEIASISGAKVELFDQGFSDFCTRDDLPDFEFIGIHGIWSWISHENQQVLIDFIRRKLKVGGVLYISYNTLPGWSINAPIRHMLTEHADIMGTRGEGSIARVKKSMDFTKELFSLCYSYQHQAPLISERINALFEQNPHYLLHEYFNRDWKPIYFSEMADSLSEAKVDYACSANFLNDFIPSNFSTEQLNFLNKISDKNFIQSTKDFMLNTQFRKDYWVKGARKLGVLEQEKIWLNLRFLMATKKDSIELEVLGATGKTNLIPEIFKPVIEVLSDNNIHTVKDIQQAVIKSNISNQQLFEVLALLYSKQDIYLIQDKEDIDLAKEKCHKLNTYILHNSLVSDTMLYLVSPITGGGISCSRINQIFLHNYTQGVTDKNIYVENVWQALEKIGNRVIKDGTMLETKEDSIKELSRLAELFEEEVLPMAKKLQLINA